MTNSFMRVSALAGLGAENLVVLGEVLWSEDLANFGFAFKFWPVLAVQLHEDLGFFEGLFFGFQIKDGKAADDFFGFGEGAVGDFWLASGEADASAFCSG